MRVSPIVFSAGLAVLGGRTAWADASPPESPGYEAMMIAAAAAGVTTGATTMKTIGFMKRSRTELSTEFFVIPDVAEGSGNGSVGSVASVISVPPPNRTISINHPTRNIGYAEDGRFTPGVSVNAPYYQNILRERSWALPLAALSAAVMLLMAVFEIFVLFKARAAAPNRRHLFLGQALLLGLFMLAGLSAAASLAPNPLSCAAFRLVGLPAALIFAALLVKCVFLLSLNSGIYLPAPYQALVLLFAVLVQVAIVGQWFYGERPDVIRPCIIGTKKLQTASSIQSHYTCCRTPLGQTVASLGYPALLLIAVAGLAIRARGIRDNYREAAFIAIAVGLTVPIWLTSAIGTIIASEVDREAWLAYGLLSTSLVLFLTMFLPKGRQLAALGREGPGGIPSVIMRNDRMGGRRDRDDDHLSSLPGSGYSFFHFKPAEGGSFKRKMDYHSTDRIALVSSALPGCNACRHGNSPVYSDDMQGPPLETFVLPHGMYIPDSELNAANLYTTLSANPNVFFQRAHPGMIY
ncbi:uncharacterized protein LOC107037108 [Diachasma alloeum]|uniref:uncharacterized protein LOC107037108 n=1 Tax=Diachasma alloeum TaxID=454923 RepID=UPI00073829B2|nr:uncharacterized protein LOC107037108 [Diachasma alloeum]